MNAAQIAVVQSTFDKVRPLSDTTAEMFSARLFELGPSEQAFLGEIRRNRGANSCT